MRLLTALTALTALVALVALAGCGSSNDPRQMAHEFALDSIACSAPADCCAVVDGCRGQLLLVSATNRAAVEVLLGEAEADRCVRCLPPPVQVDCVAGRCVALELESDGTATTDPIAATTTHCGPVVLPDGWSTKPASVGIGTSLAPATIFSCGE